MIEQLAARDRRMSLEMDIARTVHRSFLPSDAPDFLPFKIGFAFQPCFSIGGDYFDFIPFPDQNQMGVLFADISGHGVAGALLSSMLKVLILSVTEKYHDPSQVLIELNKRIEENFPDGYFVSAFFALIDRNKNEVHFSSAAPEPVLLVHSDGSVKKIGKGGQPMGLLPSEFVDPEDFSTRQIKLLPGDRIIFYTDGITDIKISEQERLGLEKFCSWVSEFATMQPQKICDELYSRAKDSAIEKGIDDDMMLLVISRDEIDSSYR
jgi:sigma-B regulation protein RsbU (phosphoserine phosphatase)